MTNHQPRTPEVAAHRLVRRFLLAGVATTVLGLVATRIVHAAPTTPDADAAIESVSASPLLRGGVPAQDVARVRRAVEEHLGAPAEILVASRGPVTSDAYACVVATKHSRFDACVLSAPHDTRAEFHAARLACAGEDGIETRVVRLEVPLVSDPSPDATIVAHSSVVETEGDPTDGGNDIWVASLGFVDVDGDGVAETWAHVVDERTSHEYEEMDEETRDEPSEIEVTRVYTSVRLYDLEGESLQSVGLVTDGPSDTRIQSFGVRLARRGSLDLVYACATGDGSRGCRRGERHVALRVARAASPRR